MHRLAAMGDLILPSPEAQMRFRCVQSLFMNTKDYKEIIASKNVLGYSTLEITLKEASANNNLALISEIDRILKNNKIPKPDLHNDKFSHTSDYYIVDLDVQFIDKIVEMFFLLEAQNVSEDGETTSTASYYASLVDQWNALLE